MGCSPPATSSSRVPNETPAFASVVIDVDSTLCGIEGIDFLAARRGSAIGAEIAGITDRAMRGEIPLEAVYGERLKIIRPARGDIEALAEAYERAVAPGAREAIPALRKHGVRLVLVSGGIRQAIDPVARMLGFFAEDVRAVSLVFDGNGNYTGFDSGSPLTTQHGKAGVLEELMAKSRIVRPVLALGDGSTDVAMAEVADTFAAFTGFARRENVVARARFEVASFTELMKHVLPS